MKQSLELLLILHFQSGVFVCLFVFIALNFFLFFFLSELNDRKLTVGKIYTGLLVAENWRAYKASQNQNNSLKMVSNKRKKKKENHYIQMFNYFIIKVGYFSFYFKNDKLCPDNI